MNQLQNLSEQVENLTNLITDLNKGLFETNPQNLTLKQYATQWLRLDKQNYVGSETYYNLNIYFNKHIFPKLGHYKLQDLTKPIIQEFFYLMPKTRTKEILFTYLKACITSAYKDELIAKNPFDNIRKEKRLNKTRGSIPIEHQKLILDYLYETNETLFKIVFTYLCTGLRRSELCNLQQQDIYENYLYIRGTKTTSSLRYIRITPQLSRFITNHHSDLTKYTANYISQLFKKAMKQLNLPYCIHQLRHTYATNHFYLGTPAKLVQEWLGHSTIDMTLNIYTNINPALDHEKIKQEIQQFYNDYYIIK